MTADDLTRRARKVARDQATVRPFAPIAALLIELADEVDRLRAEAGRLSSVEFVLHEVQASEIEMARTLQRVRAERDAARAALERVRTVAEDGDRLDGLWIYAPDLDRALEGKP